MDKIRGCITISTPSVCGRIQTSGQVLTGTVGSSGASQYYYTKREIDAFRVEDREYVDAHDLILQNNIDSAGHKLSSTLVDNLLVISLLDANDNVISFTSQEIITENKYIVSGELDYQNEQLVFYYNDETSFTVSISYIFDNFATKEEVNTETNRAIDAEQALSDRIEDLENKDYSTQDINTSSINVQYTKSTSKTTLESTADWENYLVPTNNELYSVVYGNEYYIGCGQNGAIIYSQDGKNWTLFSQIFSSQGLDKIVYGNGYFLAICYSTKTIYKAYNPNIWTVQSILENIEPINLQYVNNRFIVCGSDGKIAYSNNGEKFKVISIITNKQINSIAYGNSVYVGVGTEGLLLYSKDCEVWYNRSDNEFTEDYKNIIYVNGMFLASTNNLLRYSFNYYQFQNCSLPDITGYNIKELSYGEMSYKILLNNSTSTKILESSKGINFMLDETFNTKCNSICYGQNKFITLGTNELAYVLDLSINWSYNKPNLENNEYLWMRNVNYQNNGDVLYSQPYFMGYIDKDVADLENYYDKPTTNGLLDEKQDDMDEIENSEIDSLFN